MTTYETFRNSCLDLSILGLQDEPLVKCSPTPANAKVLGWLTEDLVHFCQIPEHGETVFAVDSNALPEEQIVPVAEDIPHFIGLLVCCPDASLIARAYQWSSFRLKELVQGVKPGMKAQSVIRALRNIYQPPVIHDPVAMMLQLRKRFHEISRETDRKITFGKDFSQSSDQGDRGQKLVLNRSLSVDDTTWHVPSIYLCNEGIVVDAYLEVAPERIRNFQESWDNRSEETLSLADKLQRRLDDPLTAAFTGILTVNDKPLRCKQSFTAIWNPLTDNTAQVRSILNCYRLDPDVGYLFRRYHFQRKGRLTQLRSMELTLEATPVMIPDQIFTVYENGTQFRFTHPATGLEHRFTALSLSSEALNPNFLTNHPCFYTRLNYALEPSISPENFRVVDCDPGDQWEGYQDEPAAVIYANRKPDPGRYALSSLHYEPQDQVRWQMVFRRKLHADVQLKLLP